MLSVAGAALGGLLGYLWERGRRRPAPPAAVETGGPVAETAPGDRQASRKTGCVIIVVNAVGLAIGLAAAAYFLS